MTDRDTVTLPGRGNAFDAFTGHVIEMRRAATNHGAERNNAVDTTRRRDFIDR